MRKSLDAVLYLYRSILIDFDRLFGLSQCKLWVLAGRQHIDRWSVKWVDALGHKTCLIDALRISDAH